MDEALIKITKNLKEQDNRATSLPIFIVQQKHRVYGIDPEIDDAKIVWYHCDGFEADVDETKELESKYDAGEDAPPEWHRTAYVDMWEFVTACFTEQGCKDFIAKMAHRLHETRIYVESGYRNDEWQTVRNHLLALTENFSDIP